MKKLITIILILAVLLPAAALAEDYSPVGAWYMCYSKAATPEMASNFGEEYDYVLDIFFFMDDGIVLEAEFGIANRTSNPSFHAAGKWEKTDDGYTFSITTFGTGKMKVEQNNIHLQVGGGATYLKLRKMYTFDPYADFSVDTPFQ